MPVDITMPTHLRRRRRDQGFCAVAIIGSDGSTLCRIQAAENIEKVVAELQPGNWHKLHIEQVVWTPGMLVARTVVHGVEIDLKPRHVMARWYDATAAEIEAMAREKIARLQAHTWSHAELVAHLKAGMHRQADQFAKGVI